MRLLGSTEKVIVKDKNVENVPKLEIVDEILMMSITIINKHQNFCLRLYLINNLDN